MFTLVIEQSIRVIESLGNSLSPFTRDWSILVDPKTLANRANPGFLRYTHRPL